MNRRYIGRHIFSTIKNAYDSALFWNRIIAITLGVIAIDTNRKTICDVLAKQNVTD